jgi:hypothetical protein
MDAIVKTIAHSDRKWRVLIVALKNGSYSFREERYSDAPLEQAWLPVSRSISICDSAETAESEARGRVQWLSDLS